MVCGDSPLCRGAFWTCFFLPRFLSSSLAACSFPSTLVTGVSPSFGMLNKCVVYTYQVREPEELKTAKPAFLALGQIFHENRAWWFILINIHAALQPSQCRSFPDRDTWLPLTVSLNQDVPRLLRAPRAEGSQTSNTWMRVSPNTTTRCKSSPNCIWPRLVVWLSARNHLVWAFTCVFSHHTRLVGSESPQ
ncbi:hypothetical protein V8F33_010502 [Rhypophila sp. PSN 637]